MDPNMEPLYGPHYGLPGNGVNSFESSSVNIRIDFENMKHLDNTWFHALLRPADMLYSGHRSIADTFSRNQFFSAMVRPLCFEPLYSGHLFIADTFSENQLCPLLRGFTVVY